jgi:hypothetical protein
MNFRDRNYMTTSSNTDIGKDSYGVSLLRHYDTPTFTGDFWGRCCGSRSLDQRELYAISLFSLHFYRLWFHSARIMHRYPDAEATKGLG